MSISSSREGKGKTGNLELKQGKFSLDGWMLAPGMEIEVQVQHASRRCHVLESSI